LVGECNLRVHELHLALEMKCQVWRSAIGAEKCDRVYAVCTKTDPAYKVAKQVLSHHQGLRSVRTFQIHAHGDKSAAGLLAIEILGHPFDVVQNVLFGFPNNLLLDCLYIVTMDKLVIRSDVAGVWTDGLARTGITADAISMFFGYGALLRGFAQKKKAGGRFGIR